VKRSRLLFLAGAAIVAALLAYTAKDSLKTNVHVARVPVTGGPMADRPRADRPVGARNVQTRSGGRRDLAQPPGKILLVHFWATWCPPCVEEFPGLLAFYKETEKNPALELVTVSVDEDWKIVDAWLKTRGATAVPVTLDPDRAAATAFGTKKFPETYILSPQGDVLLYVKGPFDWTSKEFRTRLDEIMRAAAPPSPAGPTGAQRT
jgi:thiol-disulfide isomerase/thioredoxin